MRVIFVCTGNTCRSPMAEKILSSMTAGKGVEVLSRGVMCDDGFPMNLNAKIVMREQGLDTTHTSHALTLADIESSDIVITMTASHKMYIEQLFGVHDNVHTLGEYSGKGDVLDPYGGDINEYRRCARRLSDDIAILVDKLSPIGSDSKKTKEK